MLTSVLSPRAEAISAHSAHQQVVQGVQISWHWLSQTSGSEQEQTEEAFELVNHGPTALSIQGWWLYFNAIAGATAQPEQHQVEIQRVVGTLFRLRPLITKGDLNTNQTLTLRFSQPELLNKIDKAPNGPFIVFDDQPNTAYALEQGSWQLPAEHAAPAGQNWAQVRYTQNLGHQFPEPGSLPAVFPPPKFQEREDDSTFEWRQTPKIEAAASLMRAKSLALQLFHPVNFAQTSLDSATAPAPLVSLQIAKVAGLQSPEAYDLRIQHNGHITIKGNTEAGVLCGLQTLYQLLRIAQGNAQPQFGFLLPTWHLRDEPRFAYRGLTLDIARNFPGADTILRLLNHMALLHLNTLHLHLSDDEGWRLAIPGLPELTQVGASRGFSAKPLDGLPPAYGSGPISLDTQKPQYLTRAQFINLLKYAQVRNIQVIPEIEMPGHARAAIVAMKARAQTRRARGLPDAQDFRLDDPDDASHYKSAQGYSDNVIDPVRESSFRFINKVVTELALMYHDAQVPFLRVHVGADELPHGAWHESPDCQVWLQQHPGSHFSQLWDQFYQRVEKIVTHAGAHLSGWEELGVANDADTGIPTGLANPVFAGHNIQVGVWNTLDESSRELPYRLANAGYDTILAPASHLYFDMTLDADPAEPGVDWAGSTPLTEVFAWVPEDLRRTVPYLAPTGSQPPLTANGASHLIGLEAALFSETVHDQNRLDYLLWPRLLGLAERAWVATPSWVYEPDTAKAAILFRQDQDRFLAQVGLQMLPALGREHDAPTYRIPPPGLQKINHTVIANMELPGFLLRYTCDGGRPTQSSKLVTGPITETGLIQVAAFNAQGRSGRTSTMENH